jgi:hypothetical protein
VEDASQTIKQCGLNGEIKRKKNKQIPPPLHNMIISINEYVKKNEHESIYMKNIVELY